MIAARASRSPARRRPPPCGRITSVGGTTRRNSTHNSSGTKRSTRSAMHGSTNDHAKRNDALGATPRAAARIPARFQRACPKRRRSARWECDVSAVQVPRWSRRGSRTVRRIGPPRLRAGQVLPALVQVPRRARRAARARTAALRICGTQVSYVRVQHEQGPYRAVGPASEAGPPPVSDLAPAQRLDGRRQFVRHDQHVPRRIRRESHRRLGRRDTALPCGEGDGRPPWCMGRPSGCQPPAGTRAASSERRMRFAIRPWRGARHQVRTNRPVRTTTTDPPAARS
ncbi:hypothetical protein RKD18_000240 [Streptomyces phaeoluteigriseus]